MNDDTNRSSNKRRVLAGVAAAMLVTAALIMVGAGAYRAGERQSDRVEIVGDAVAGEGATGTILIRGDEWGHGPGFGFLVFPLIVGGLFVLFAARRGRWGGPRRFADDDLGEWHRRAHADDHGPAAG